MTPNPYNTDLDRNPANYQPLTPLTFLERAASVFPEHTAIVHGALRRSYAEFYARSRQLASALAQHGDRAGRYGFGAAGEYTGHAGMPLRCADVRRCPAFDQHPSGRRRSLPSSSTMRMSRIVIVDREFMPLMQEALALATVKPVLIQYDDPEFDGARAGF